MYSLKFVCFLIVIAIASLEASPVPQTQANDFSFVDRALNADDLFSGSPSRQGRQNYFYDYPFSYADYYNKPVPAYPDYYNSYYDPSYYAPAPVPQPNRRPSGYPSKKTQRRKGSPFEPTTQKYTVWDLARK